MHVSGHADQAMPGGGGAGPAETIFRGVIRTMDPALPVAEAVAVRGHRIIAVGSAREVERHRGAGTVIRDLAGGALFPGFIDSHAHVGGFGKALRQVRLEAATSARDAARLVCERVGLDASRAGATRDAAGGWIEGRGWDQNDWPDGRYPTWRDLEGVSGRPIALRRVDGHALWVNRAALAAAGMTRETAEVAGGKILRDEAGEPTGVLIDAAMPLVVDRIPPPGPEELVHRLRTAMREIAAAGLTGVMDAGVDARGIAAYRTLAEEDAAGEGAFLARVDVFLADDPALLESWWARGAETGAAGGRLSIRGVKMFADGALGSRGAALMADYSDDPGNRGLVVTDPAHMLAVTRRSLAAGFDVAIHAIGDRANRMVLDVFEAARGTPPAGRAPDGTAPSCRVEHAQVLAPEDLGRFAALGVVASMQPIHATADMGWAEARLGAARIRGAYAWRSVLASGALVALGSDFPVEDHRPLLGIYAAVTRRGLDGRPREGWYPGECLSIEEAVRGFTIDAARAAGAASMRGSIEAGKEADLVVLSKDLFALPPEEIPEVEVRLTMNAGRVVHER